MTGNHATHRPPAAPVVAEGDGWTSFLLNSTAGHVALGLAVLGLACIWSEHVRFVVRPFWRLVTGAPVFARLTPWHSSWLRPAPERPENRPSFRGESYPLTFWGRMAGWRRMLARWAAAGYAWALVQFRAPTALATLAVVLTVSGVRLRRLVEDVLHGRAVGAFAEGAAVLLKREDDPTTWIAVPRLRLTWQPVIVTPTVVAWFDAWPKLQHHITAALRRVSWVDRLAVPVLRVPLERDDAQVLVALDAKLVDVKAIQTMSNIGTGRLPEGPWEHTHHTRAMVVEFRHPQRPPASVVYDEDAFRRYPVDEVPVGQRAGGSWVTLPLKKLTPHGVMSATTGWCKTTFGNVYVAHTAGNGGRAFINDPKRVGFTHFDNLPHVVIRTTPEGWADTIETVHAEMERRYQLIERFPEIKEDPERFFQPWFLVVDERGSYVSDLRDYARQQGEKGLPTVFKWEKKILWQGRAAGIYVMDLCQQASLNVFIDSDGRDQRMWRIASGPQSRSSWMMLFAGVAKMATAVKKGRAVVGIGVDSVEEVQLAQITDAEARDFAAAGAGVAERENKLRAQRLAALTGGQDAPVSPVASPGHTAPGVRPEDSDTRTTEDGTNVIDLNRADVIPGQRPETDTTEHAGKSGDIPAGAAEAPREYGEGAGGRPGAGAVIVGIRSAGELLGMSEEAFSKARQRRPIPGEFRTGIQPSWTELELREWRSRAPRAGGAA